jgi:hypothetical protein
MYFLQSQVVQLVLVTMGHNNMNLTKAFGGLGTRSKTVRKPLEIFLITADE